MRSEASAQTGPSRTGRAAARSSFAKVRIETLQAVLAEQAVVGRVEEQFRGFPSDCVDLAPLCRPVRASNTP